MIEAADVGRVGIFWFVKWKGTVRVITASCQLSAGEPYGDMITYGTGHHSTWNRWRKSKTAHAERIIARAYEYEEWPRGRVSYNQVLGTYLLLCDRQIIQYGSEIIMNLFGMPDDKVTIGGDPHYKSTESIV